MELASYQAREGLTLSALAGRLGRPVSTVHGWLSGARRPDWASLEAIVAATGGAVTADDFLTRPPAPGLAEKQAPLRPTDPAIIEAARALGVDVEAVCARALNDAIGAERARRWQEENRASLDAWNDWVEKNGIPLARYRAY